MATTILAIVAIIFLVVFVYFVYKYVTNSSIQEILMRERNKHLLAIVKKDGKESKQHVKKEEKKEEKTEEKSQSSTLKLTPVQEQERDKIINALNHHGGDLCKASVRIGMSHIAFYSKAKEYDLLSMIKKTSNVLLKLERQYHYIKLRQKGCSIIEAANAVYVQRQTAEKYELVYLTNK